MSSSSPDEKESAGGCGDDSFVAPSPLLKELERDLSDKDSVKDCLRSKTIPAAEVKAVLQHHQSHRHISLNRQELHLSYCLLLTKYLGPLKDTCTKETEHTTLWFCERIGTLTRFLQLVLEFREETEPDDETQTEPDYVTPSVTADAEICKMILQLIRSVTGVACSIVERANNNNNNEQEGGSSSSSRDDVEDIFVAENIDEAFDATAVACFVFESMLRINYYVRSRPFLLSPLWKGLCDLAVGLHQLPAELIQETVVCLTGHLQDGCQPVLTSCMAVITQQQQKRSDKAAATTAKAAVVDPNEQAFLIKILGFLLARLTVFLKMPVKDVESSKFGRTVQVLTLLRGIGSAVEIALSRQQQSEAEHQLSEEMTAFLKPYNQIATKVDRCFHAWLSNEPTEETATLSHARIAPLVKSALSSNWKNEKYAAVARPAFAIGKTMLLVKNLEDALTQKQDESNNVVWYEQDVESFLLVVEDLLLRSLPAAIALDSAFVGTSSTTASSRLLARAMRTVSTILLKCETETACIASNVHPGRGRFHGVLIKWLLPSQRHPLSNELTITAVQFHVMGLCGDPSNTNCNDAIPLLTLLVSLLFDKRTVSCLRSNIASLLKRLLRSANQYQFLSKKLEELINERYASFEKHIVPMKKERYSKRKRKQPKLGYDVENLSIIVSLLTNVTKPLRTGCGFLEKVNCDRPLSKKTLQAAAVHTTLSDFTEADDFALLLSSFLKLWNGQNRFNFQQCGRQFEFLSVSVLRQVRTVLKKRGGSVSYGELEATCNVLALCTATSVLDPASGDSSFLPGPVFEAIRVLGVFGSVIQPTCPKSKLKELAHCFHRLLACQSWAIRAYAMTSLVKFASTIPSVHQDILRSCVPTGMQQLLQCRLQGKVDGEQVDTLAILQSQCNDALLRAIPIQPCRTNKFFPVASSFTFPTGSYFMMMPTQEGRQAVVIFPPGEKSLEDIRYMLDMDDDVDDESICKQRNIQMLQRVSVSQGGAKLQLQQQDELASPS